MLADCYSHPSHCSWEFRRNLLRNTLKEYAANTDIFLLQEVDHYYDFYQEILLELGYSSTYLIRPTRKDGVVVAFLTSKFILSATDEIYFDDLALNKNAFKAEYRDETYVRNNVAIVCLFECILCRTTKNSDEPQTERLQNNKFIASNCHLFWNPNRPEVKEAQAQYLIDRIKMFKRQHDISETDIPIIIAGDFNILPSSPIYKEICDGFSSSLSAVPSISKSHKFIADYNLSKLARWMRVLGIDCIVESKDSQAMRSDKKSDSGAKKVPSKADYSMLFDTARREGRVLLTSSRTMRERASCPPSMLIKTKDLEQELSKICVKYDIEVSEAKFLTVCGKCGGPIESIEADDIRLRGRFLPTDREVFACTQCLQPYWWNDRINSSPARAMRVAERLHKVIKCPKEIDSGTIIVEGVPDSSLTKDAIDSEVEINVSLESSNGATNALQNNTSIHFVSEEPISATPSSDTFGYDSSDSKQSDALLESQRLGSIFARRSQTLTYEKSTPPIESDQPLTSDSNITSEATDTERFIKYQSIHSRLRNHEPPLTNCNGEFVGTLDYIFISDHSNSTSTARAELEVLEAAVYPKLRNLPGGRPDFVDYSDGDHKVVDLLAKGPLPNSDWPSDHLMVFGSFALRIKSASSDSCASDAVKLNDRAP